MRPGDIVRVVFEQADRTEKQRPAVLLKKTEPHGDWITCAISSKLHLEIKNVDIIIDQQHPDFTSCGLNFSGLIRVGFLITIPESIIEGTIGNLSNSTINQLMNNLANYLKK